MPETSWDPATGQRRVLARRRARRAADPLRRHQTRPPVFAEGEEARRSIPENTLAGVDVGPPLTATDPEGDVVTYGLEGTDAVSFDLLSETGQIQTRGGVVYDFEAKETYSVLVTASDPQGAVASIDVTIALIDDDEEEEQQNVPPGRPPEPVVTAATLTSLTVRWEPPEKLRPPDHRLRSRAPSAQHRLLRHHASPGYADFGDNHGSQ